MNDLIHATLGVIEIDYCVILVNDVHALVQFIVNALDLLLFLHVVGGCRWHVWLTKLGETLADVEIINLLSTLLLWCHKVLFTHCEGVAIVCNLVTSMHLNWLLGSVK